LVKVALERCVQLLKELEAGIVVLELGLLEGAAGGVDGLLVLRGIGHESIKPDGSRAVPQPGGVFHRASQALGGFTNEMEAQAWPAVALLAATLLGVLLFPGAKIDSINGRIDSTSGRIDTLAARLDSRIDRLDSRVDRLDGKLDDHLLRHAG
jgi:hypothetical protein